MCRAYLAIVLFVAAKPASAIQITKGLDTCPSLSACMTLLDKVVPHHDDGEGSGGDVLAEV